jgi:Protein of unknown function (DUF4239)
MMYWVYDISSLSFALMTVAAFVTFGVTGLLVTRWFLGRRSTHVLETNDIVSFYFSAIVGFYGITLGLISVGVWQTFSDADNKSTLEAAAIEALFRDITSYPEPPRSNMQLALENYTRNVINVAWPAQRKGLQPKGGSELMTILQKQMFPFEPQTQGQMALHQEALRQYNRLSELRRLRVLSATSGLPGTTWWVVILGAAASILLTWMFSVDNVRRHLFLTGLYSGLIGLLIFLIAALDNPYRGEFSVGPDAFELVLERMGKM